METLKLTRQEGWEARFSAVIESARHAPYVLGQHDCLRLSCESVRVVTFHDFWPRFCGYRTKRQAHATILRIAPSLSAAVSLTLEQLPGSHTSARRADLVLYRDTEDHLGICVGSSVAVLAPDGLRFVPLGHPGLIECWRVG